MSERLSREGSLPDGIVPEGQEHNPNPAEQVEANRARFEAMQRQIRADQQQSREAALPIQHEVELQFERAQSDPEHEAMRGEQQQHGLHDPLPETGGQSRDMAPVEVRNTPLNPEVNIPAVQPLNDARARRGESAVDDHTPGG
ncbi:MAG: hypothetical protein NVS4B8_29040 [Herpetosiphon sp.]